MKALDQITLEPRERDALGAAVRALRGRFPIAEVVLFGSRARGEGDAESDLDLLVLTTRTLDWRERHALVDSLFDIELACDVVFSPLVVARQEWREGRYAILPIHAEVERDGIVV